MGYGDFASRGVSTWQRGGERRIFVATIDARLIALDATTGAPVPGFGEQGIVDLRQGLRIRADRLCRLSATSPPAVIGDTIVVGSSDCRRHSTPHPSGEVRGFDAIDRQAAVDLGSGSAGCRGASARTRGRTTAPTRTGGANAWSVIVADPARNLVFVPTSSPSHDYFGGERLGDNLFANSVVALRADTGERVWHFQTVHHDLWDYDVASPPILFDWRKRRPDDRRRSRSRRRPAICSSSIARPGSRSFPSRSAPCRRATCRVKRRRRRSRSRRRRARWRAPRCSAEEAWGATDEDRAWCRETMRALRSEGFFTPPSLKGTLVVPGNVGGMAWGGIAHDRVNDLLIMPVNNLAAEVRLIPRDAGRCGAQGRPAERRVRVPPQRGTPYGVVRRFLLGSEDAAAVHAAAVGHAGRGQGRDR